MDNIINLEERKKIMLAKKETKLKEKEYSLKLSELLSDIETIEYLISKGEIRDLTLIFKFRENYCYYGRDEDLNLKSLDYEKIKEEVDKINKEVEFE